MLLELDAFGDRQVDRELLRFADRAVDATPAWAQIIIDLAHLEHEQFASEGALASAGWAPLAPATVARKAAAGLDPRILHATGKLAASLTEPLGGGDAIREVAPDEMRFGTTVPYARFHQLGTERMPQRRPIELRERDRRALVQTLQRFLVTGHPT